MSTRGLGQIAHRSRQFAHQGGFATLSLEPAPAPARSRSAQLLAPQGRLRLAGEL